MSQQLFRLSDHDLRGLAAAIRSHRIAPPWSALALQRLLPSSVCEDAAAELRLLADQGLSGDQLAAMLEFVVGDREHRRADAETIECGWTWLAPMRREASECPTRSCPSRRRGGI